MRNLSKLCSGGRRDAVHHPRCCRCRCRCSTGCHTLWRTNNPAIQFTALTLHVSWQSASTLHTCAISSPLPFTQTSEATLHTFPSSLAKACQTPYPSTLRKRSLVALEMQNRPQLRGVHHDALTNNPHRVHHCTGQVMSCHPTLPPIRALVALEMQNRLKRSARTPCTLLAIALVHQVAPLGSVRAVAQANPSTLTYRHSHSIDSAGCSGWFCVECPLQLECPRGLGSMGEPSVPLLGARVLGRAISSLASQGWVLGRAASSLTCCWGGFHDALRSITTTTITRLPPRK
jgi:hypothetical protein